MSQVTLLPSKLKVAIDPQGDPLRPFETLTTHTYDDGLVHVTVPFGYRTDLTSGVRNLGFKLLATMPLQYFFDWWVWLVAGVAMFALVLRDPAARCHHAALFHDRAYELGHNKRVCDAVFSSAMSHVGEHWARHFCNYWGVVLFGGRAYWRHRKARKRGARK